MGWKNVKDHYGITDVVHVRDGHIRIGALGDFNIIVIDPEGKIISARKTDNADISRHLAEMRADRKKVRALVAAPDTFRETFPVYTCSGSQIVEARCERYGFPHTTTDGELMHTHFYPEREQALEYGRSVARERVEFMRQQVEGAEAVVRHCKEELAIREATLTALV
jgi:hypothetical protein